MGNAAVGREIDIAAHTAVLHRQPGESALTILDRICSRHRGCDAEFESEDPGNPQNVHPDFDRSTDPHPKAPLGMLLLEAFAPGGIADHVRYAPMLHGEEGEEEACEAWWSEVYDKFRARYDFC